MPKHRNDDRGKKKPTASSLAKGRRIDQQLAAQAEARKNRVGKPLRYCIETTHRRSEATLGKP